MPWEDNLDDFERQLAADKAREEAERQQQQQQQGKETSRRDRGHHHRHERQSHRHHHHHHHGSSHQEPQSRHGEGDYDHIDERDRHRHKRRRRSRDREHHGADREVSDRPGRAHEHEHRHRHRHRHRGDDRDGKAEEEEEEEEEKRERRHSRRERERSTTDGRNGNNEGEEEQQDGQEGGGQRFDDEKKDQTDGSLADEKEEGEGEREVLKRDAWMQAPSALDIDYVHRRPQAAKGTETQDPIRPGSPRARLDLKIHEAELNKHHLQELAEGRGGGNGGEEGLGSSAAAADLLDEPAEHEVGYEFGDGGSRWRMMKLRNVYREAEESERPVEEVALRQYGSLRAFDDAREEETEMDRRKSYGEGYVGKSKPSGELFQERKLEAGIRREKRKPDDQDSGEDNPPTIQTIQDDRTPSTTTVLDPTALNRLRAQMMKAKLKGLPEAATLEREYETAQQASETGGQPGDLVVLNAMENRMLAGGGRREEVREAGKRRARERGQVEENEDMSIEDMVREERRTKGIFGNEDRRFASRIAKDGKFTNDLDYMDENATKLAKRVHQSDSALRSSAIAQHRQTSSVLASCPLCHQEDRPHDPLPVAPVVSLAHRTFLTLPTSPEISPHGGAVIVPLSHHDNLLSCDDDEWEEMRNFMKSLARLYFSKNLGVLFYENAAHPRKHRHAALTVVPVPLGLAEDAPAFFREAILASDDEWAQHRKIIDTRGKGRGGFRRSLAKEMPYFHVWTELDGGLGHVIEDERRWPQGDLFAREVLGGMLRVGTEVWRRQGRWDKSSETVARIERFRKSWEKFDWTKVLVDGDGSL